MRTDIRDLGMGDGYCGFQLLVPPYEHQSKQNVVEIRERRFGRVLGRITRGEGGTRMSQELRLDTVAAALDAANRALEIYSKQLRKRAAPLEELGAILLRSSGWPEPLIDSSRAGVHAVYQDRMAAIPYTDLGWCPNPRVSLVVRPPDAAASCDVITLAGALRQAACAIRPIGAEIILLEDGTEPLAGLLPSRLRHLRLVRTGAASSPGAELNTAVLSARGMWLAFVRPGALDPAGLLDAFRCADQGTSYMQASASHPKAIHQYHRLQCLIERKAIDAMGGFDPVMEEPGMWSDVLEKAELVGQRIVRWKSTRECGLRLYAGGDQKS